jgi:hypothetical protein
MRFWLPRFKDIAPTISGGPRSVSGGRLPYIVVLVLGIHYVWANILRFISGQSRIRLSHLARPGQVQGSALGLA